ncbi:MAG: oligosaccharide flippase family protein [Clostridia bacterium]|nr:oligosaccharide flippase family protein [Clostridia bacterium]
MATKFKNLLDTIKNSTLIKGVLVLGFSGILCKLIGVFYRVPLTNILGSEGMGIYGLIYPIYSLLLVISSSALPLALSKIVAEKISQQDFIYIKRLKRIAFNLMLIVGAILFAVVAYFSNQIASWQGSADAGLGLLLISPSILIVGLICVYRGIFQGYSNVKPTAFSQGIEQGVKLVLGLLFAICLLPLGLGFAVGGAMLGITLSEVVALGYLVYKYHSSIKDLHLDKLKQRKIKKNKNINLSNQNDNLVFSQIDNINIQGNQNNIQHFNEVDKLVTNQYNDLKYKKKIKSNQQNNNSLAKNNNFTSSHCKNNKSINLQIKNNETLSSEIVSNKKISGDSLSNNNDKINQIKINENNNGDLNGYLSSQNYSKNLNYNATNQTITINASQNDKVKTTEILKQLLKTILPITLGGIVIPVSLVIDSFLIVNLLVESVALSDALTSYGLYSGVVNTIINVPIVLISSLGIVLMPMIAKCKAQGQAQEVAGLVSKGLNLTFLIAVPCVLLMAIFPSLILHVLYPALPLNEINIASRLLCISSSTVLSLGLFYISTTIMQGLGISYFSCINSLIACVLKVLLYIFLIQIYGIYGVAMATAIMFFIMAISNVVNMFKYADVQKLNLVKILLTSLIFIALIFCIYASLVAIIGVYSFLISAILSVAFYLFMNLNVVLKN